MSRSLLHRRVLRAGALLCCALAGLSCGGDGPTPPPAPRAARLTIAPALPQGAAGGPAFAITSLRAVLSASATVGALADSTVVTAAYAGAGTTLQADLTITEPSRVYAVKLTAIDASGDTVFRGADTARAWTLESGAHGSAALTLAYARADAGVTAIQVAPGDTTVSSGDTLRLRVAATAGGTATPAVGWASRDATGATVTSAGTLTAGKNRKPVWLVATTFTGVQDSVRVTVEGAPAAVAITTDPLSLAYGDSAQLAAEVKDSAGTALPNRSASYTSLDPAKATVDAATGMLRSAFSAAASADSVRIVAANGGLADTLVVRLTPLAPAALLVTPVSPALTVGDSVALGATVADAEGRALAGRAVTWTSLDPAKATVDSSGMVRAALTLAAQPGSVRIEAAVGAVKDTAVVTLDPVPATVAVTAGDLQVGVAGQGFLLPVTIVATGPGGAPLPGRDVSVIATQGGGSLAAPATTDATGTAQLTLHYGATPGRHAFAVSAGRTTTPDTVHADATLDRHTVAAGAAFACATDDSAAPSCWGSNDQGQLGSPAISGSSQPVPVAGGHAFVTLSTGHGDSENPRSVCALTAGGQAYCWGTSRDGQLAIVPTDDCSVRFRATNPICARTPRPVPGGLTFVSISVGAAGGATEYSSRACGVTLAGDAYCWGAGQNGELGNGTFGVTTAPVLVAGGHRFVQIATNRDSSCGVTAAGEVWCWGANDAGQLGDGTRSRSSIPVRVASTERFVRVEVGGGRSACALSADGRLQCWGSFTGGKLGTGGAGTVDALSPVAVAGGHAFSSFTLGQDHACAVTTAGAAYCWGAGGDGQLGTGRAETELAPALVSGGYAFRELSGGVSSTCGRTTLGHVMCWGENRFGALGVGDPIGWSFIPLKVRFGADVPGAPAKLAPLTRLAFGRASIGSTLGTTPTVRVTDANGVPVPGVTVTFAVTGGGSVQNPIRGTTSGGWATPGFWTLGPNPGIGTLTATAEGLADTVVFTAEGAVPGPPAYLLPGGVPLASRAAGETVLASALDAPYVLIGDASFLATAGAKVLFEQLTPGGSILPADGIVTADASGKARLDAWTTDTVPGTNTVRATLLDANGRKIPGQTATLSIVTTPSP